MARQHCDQCGRVTGFGPCPECGQAAEPSHLWPVGLLAHAPKQHGSGPTRRLSDQEARDFAGSHYAPEDW